MNRKAVFPFFMRESLYGKFLIGYLLFALLSVAFITTYVDRMVEDRLVEYNAGTLNTEASALAAQYEDSGIYVSVMTQEVTQELRTLSKFTEAEIWLVSSGGHIAYDTAGKNTGKDISGFDLAVDADHLKTTFGDLYPSPVLSVFAPVHSNFSVLGYVVLNYPMDYILENKNQIMNLVYITLLVILALSLILLLIFHFSVYLPLRKITGGAQEYAKGNMDYRIDVGDRRDEIEYLATTLNYMAEEQANLEKYQRDFVANVSHDFRSPLTSIKGYLVAILDGTIPEELHEKYLTRVISETERLHKLTEEMLTLGNLDSKGLLRRTAFDINRMIRDICNSYENACSEKNLSFELLFEEPEEKVYADHEKIQRVLYNLIDNAIKFSYQGTVITITTSARQKKVYISIRDRGIGIPRASLKKIWDRFYKTDASRGKDKKGTGLGLSIVREIIAAHNETIDVISTEKVGSEFTFTLPVPENSQQGKGSIIQ